MSKKVLFFVLGLILLAGLMAGLFLAFDIQSPQSTGSNNVTEPVACTMEAKICPDGTAVGRQGPNCEFAPCPSADAISGQVTTYLGGNATTMNVTVSPTELVSDSRCPQDVNCFWAGTVEVRTALATAVTHGEHIFTLHEPYSYGEYTITLVEVSPEKTVESIPSSSYRFTFEIKRTN